MSGKYIEDIYIFNKNNQSCSTEDNNNKYCDSMFGEENKYSQKKEEIILDIYLYNE